MKDSVIIKDRTVHIWRLLLSDFQANHFRSILNRDELNRADRFHFPLHRERFTITRGLLRKILSLYTNQNPNEIKFGYGNRGKPYLLSDKFLQFNISHSNEVAIVGLTVGHEIGVDIEKIEDDYKDEIAKKFFSAEEYNNLSALPTVDQAAAFYQLWTGKEAIIKAMGEGLYVPLGSFNISLDKKLQKITVIHNKGERKYFLEYITSFPGFQSAFATDHEVDTIVYQTW